MLKAEAQEPELFVARQVCGTPLLSGPAGLHYVTAVGSHTYLREALRLVALAENHEFLVLKTQYDIENHREQLAGLAGSSDRAFITSWLQHPPTTCRRRTSRSPRWATGRAAPDAVGGRAGARSPAHRHAEQGSAVVEPQESCAVLAEQMRSRRHPHLPQSADHGLEVGPTAAAARCRRTPPSARPRRAASGAPTRCGSSVLLVSVGA